MSIRIKTFSLLPMAKVALAVIREKLPQFLELKYHLTADVVLELGPVREVREIIIGFQGHLYAKLSKLGTLARHLRIPTNFGAESK